MQKKKVMKAEGKRGSGVGGSCAAWLAILLCAGIVACLHFLRLICRGRFRHFEPVLLRGDGKRQ